MVRIKLENSSCCTVGQNFSVGKKGAFCSKVIALLLVECVLIPSVNNRVFVFKIRLGLSFQKKPKNSCQYKLLCTISNNIEVYEEPVPWTNKIPHCAVEFEAGEENRIVHESL